MLRFFRKYHKWFSLFATLFILLFAVSGIILNHREGLAEFDVDRKWLPEIYRYKNWNLAAVRGCERIGRDSLLLYGNTGIWLADSSLADFRDFNRGFPDGSDNRKVSSVARGRDGSLYAGTQFGLWNFEPGAGAWVRVSLPVEGSRVVKVLFKGDSLLVMTRSNLLIRTKQTAPFNVLQFPPATDDDGRTGLFKTLWVIHSGEIYGRAGRFLVDAVGGLFVILCITGLVYWAAPVFVRRARKTAKERIRQFNRFSLKWHNYIGSWAILFLLLTTATGMFLRPPLLIPIAGSRVGKIPFSVLDNPNPWFDRLRDIAWDGPSRRFIIATSEGIYHAGEELRDRPEPFAVQPPVSVMGINVLTPAGNGSYLVGSFNGLFRWNPESGEITDYLTGEACLPPESAGPPFGATSVAGYLRRPDGEEVIFDYARGALTLVPGEIIHPMTPEILSKSPISLWNLNLEIHTGRIFEPLTGPFYIFVVPLVGLATLFILVSGFFSWWLARRKAEVRHKLVTFDR